MARPGGAASPRVAELHEHERQALDLRIAGRTFDQIATELETSRTSAYRWVVSALEKSDEAMAERGALFRELEARRLEVLLHALWPVATGATRVLPSDDKTDPDEAAFDALVKATDRVVKIMERRARLLGLDVPPRPPTEDAASVVLSPGDAAFDELQRAKWGAVRQGAPSPELAAAAADEAPRGREPEGGVDPEPLPAVPD